MKFILRLMFIISGCTLGIAQVDFTSSNLPIVLLETGGDEIPDEPKLTAIMRIIYNGPGQRNTISDEVYNYNGSIGIELRGNSSQSFDQKQYAVETRTSTGENFNVPLLGMPAENDWVLYAPWNDISMIRNVMAYHLWDKMNHWGPRTRMVEVLLNGEYQGVYVLTESIKRDKNRVSTAKLKEDDISGNQLTGGYIMKIDASNSETDKSFESKIPGLVSGNGGFGGSSSTTVTWLYHYPDPKEIQPEQEQFIHDYIDMIEALIQSDDFDDSTEGYSKYLSLPSFIDYFIHSELSLNSDGFKRSAYFYKEKLGDDGTKGKFKAGPVWDYNLAFGNCNFCKGNQMNAWSYEGCETLPTPAMWDRLLEDPNFANAVQCRFKELRNGILNDDYINTYIDAYADTLAEAQVRHFEQWDVLLDDGSSGGWGSPLWFSAYRVSSYAEEMDTLKKWFSARLGFLEDNLPGECAVSLVNDELYSSLDVFLFPNPTVDVVVLEAVVGVSGIVVFNESGRILLSKSLHGKKSVVLNEFKDFQHGAYMLNIRLENGDVVSRQVIKE